MNTFAELDCHRRSEHSALTTAIGVVCGLGFAGATVPAVEHGITSTLLTLTALGVLVAVARLMLRVVRERREDRADVLAAIAWRAAHLPDHPLTAHDRAAALDGRSGRHRVGVC